jgi:surface polysaccharide O-acyltransferase-like enzyme
MEVGACAPGTSQGQGKQMAKRIGYFDVLRGVAIIAVVAIHASGSGLQFPTTDYNFIFTVLWRNLMNFAVPLFLAVSGYFLSRKPMTSPYDWFSFLRKQVPRVYLPLLVWSLVWLTVSVLLYHASIYREVIKLLTFQSSVPYYFIALILQYYVLLPALQRLACPKGLVVSTAISLAVCGAIYYIRYHTDRGLPFILYAGNFATWLMFFVLGLYLGNAEKAPVSNRVLMLLLAMFYTLSCVESFALVSMYDQPGNAVTAVKASSFLYSLVLIVYLFNNQGRFNPSILRAIGEKAFGIYLIHMFALHVESRAFAHLLPRLSTVTPVYQVALVGAALLTCYVCISATNRILSTRQSRLIGFS